ncbi:MAG: hypothetical protein IJ849_04650 [Selenomonadaceae bacterium]|nr:hypothetical protein [Selenomonadaceae bacterium]
MFKVGGIYKFETLHYEGEEGFRSREIREYMTRDGVRCPDILIDEECKTTKISEEGYYKVLEILGERNS